MGGRCKRCCQTSMFLQLVADCRGQNSLEAEIMGGQGSNMGLSAVGCKLM